MTIASRSSFPRKMVVYSAIIDDYDVPLPPRRLNPAFDYILLSNTAMKAHGWTVRPLPEPARGLSSSDANRWCKMFAHEIFPEYDYSVYLDGNMRSVGELEILLNEFITSGAEIGLFKHPARRTVSEELIALCASDRFTSEEKLAMAAQAARYKNELPPDSGIPLSENGVIFRRHVSPHLSDAMSLWWQEFRHGSKRDQLSLPWVLKKIPLQVHRWGWSFRKPNPYFIHMPHLHTKQRTKLSIARYYLSMHRKTLRNQVRRYLSNRRKTRATDA
ncbi:glycosyltransferase domain-containing protein [Thioclava sp. F28-4]|uniref:glycosyltransferase domain-containing protein n=1 Tax=Thioclava sp. F28-4 TaxID=1915315 RepID=UPI00099623AB|nr:glycosyltransferase domain-containing protein [Thioclava sp. F28-4]